MLGERNIHREDMELSLLYKMQFPRSRQMIKKHQPRGRDTSSLATRCNESAGGYTLANSAYLTLTRSRHIVITDK